MKRKRYIKLMMSRYHQYGREMAVASAYIANFFDRRSKPTIEVNGSLYNTRGYAFWWARENTSRIEDAAVIAATMSATGGGERAKAGRE